MALQLGATRAAFLAAHVPADLADKAAEELASYETRFATVEGRLGLPTWMVGTNIALTLAIVGKLSLTHRKVRLHQRLGHEQRRYQVLHLN